MNAAARLVPLFGAGHRVERVRPEDAVEVEAVYRQVWSPSADLWSDIIASQHPTIDEIRIWLACGFELYRVRDQELTAGVMRCVFAGGVCLLDNLAVVAPSRRRGIGRALLRRGLGRGRDNGARVAWLTVDARLSEALGLVFKLGFRETWRHLPLGASGEAVLFEARL